MVINKDGLITENPIDVIEKTVSEIESENLSVNSSPIKDDDDTVTLSTDLHTNPKMNCDTQDSNSCTINDEKSNESQAVNEKTAETNCLALTVRKNYNLSIVKNSIFTTLRISWKVALSTLVLNILKLFF